MKLILPVISKIKLTKFVAGLATCFVFFVLSTNPVLAQLDSAESLAETAGLATTSLTEIIGTLINVFFSLLGIVFLVLTIYAGWLWMTAGGEEEKVQKAKDVMIRAVVGLIITLSAYSISVFVINALTDAGITGSGGSSSSGGGSSSSFVSTEARSASLGDGITDHYPARGASDVSRNTRIFVTFSDAMDIESFINGYDVGSTPEDVSDDTLATAINSTNVKIYVTEEGEDNALSGTDVAVDFTDDLKTFVFYPPILGSSTQDINYTVYLDDAINNSSGESIVDTGGYEWTFTVGTTIDLTSPTVTSVRPVAGGIYDRNITVEIGFSEAIDPTSASGIRESDSGFDNIQVAGTAGTPITGEYEISNGYKTVTFTTDDSCGTNSCGETIYCLPADQIISGLIKSATPGKTPPQVTEFPYDGVVDVSGNALDGLEDSTYADYEWSFTTSDDISLAVPEIESIVPDILEADIDLDQPVVVTFGCDISQNPSLCDSVMMTSTISSDNISLSSTPEHDLFYYFSSDALTSENVVITSDSEVQKKTQSTIEHGTFLESTDSQTYLYDVLIGQGVRNEYQNCYSPAGGPSAGGGSCGTTTSLPYCCDGVATASECNF